ncbi:hypothetical protein [Maribellus maritimus]|uniref:hypothetical protein n=1 Tax=Maribellus maritimus TaxID=2870838 RepID=UPI001EEBA5B7|nr:hypothetical protein [Maribellus maritimus]MCG6188190.1 hypothetical protein [Maribellus maritimus]
MKLITYIKFVFGTLTALFLSLNVTAQTSVSLKSQWLDPTNLFTEKVPTAEFSTTFSVGGPWSLYFYYAHDIEGLTPIYLIGGVNNTRESVRTDSLVFSSPEARVFPKYSRNIFVSYQYSETIRQLSWIQPIVTWDWNFIKNPSKSVHTLSAEVSGWMSFQRGNEYQDGGYISGKYNCAKHYEKWTFNGSLSTLAIEIFESGRNIFVLGEVLSLSSTYIPFNTTLEVVLNKPLITEEDSELGFTIGLIKEF